MIDIVDDYLDPLRSNIPLFKKAYKRGEKVNTMQNWPICLVCMSNRW